MIPRAAVDWRQTLRGQTAKIGDAQAIPIRSGRSNPVVRNHKPPALRCDRKPPHPADAWAWRATIGIDGAKPTRAVSVAGRVAGTIGILTPRNPGQPAVFADGYHPAIGWSVRVCGVVHAEDIHATDLIGDDSKAVVQADSCRDVGEIHRPKSVTAVDCANDDGRCRTLECRPKAPDSRGIRRPAEPTEDRDKLAADCDHIAIAFARDCGYQNERCTQVIGRPLIRRVCRAVAGMHKQNDLTVGVCGPQPLDIGNRYSLHRGPVDRCGRRGSLPREAVII